MYQDYFVDGRPPPYLRGGELSTSIVARLAPHCEHLSFFRIVENGAVPYFWESSKPSTVWEWPHRPHSINRPARNRMRSAAERTCFVDIGPHWAGENDS